MKQKRKLWIEKRTGRRRQAKLGKTVQSRFPRILPSVLTLVISLAFLDIFPSGTAENQPAPAGVFYGIGHWDAGTYGNHRALVAVSEPGDAVWIHLPWRRRDSDPEKKNIIIVDAATGKRVENLFRARINSESGDLVFQPQTVPGLYFVYYMPFRSTGSRHYPKVAYPSPEETADPAWLARNGLRTTAYVSRQLRRFPQARLREFQAVDAFDSFYPMEVAATAAEVRQMLRQRPRDDSLVFPEERTAPIRPGAPVPLKWKSAPVPEKFSGTAAAGEFYVFQLGIFAGRRDIEGMSLRFGDLLDASGACVVAASAFRCFNLGGSDWQGTPFRSRVGVRKGRVQPLWIGFQIPERAAAGEYRSEVTVSAENCREKRIPIAITLKGGPLSAAGDDEPWRLSRLRWLDSQLAADNTVVKPFTPLQVDGRTVSCLGRSVGLDEAGMAASISTFFDPEMTRLTRTGRQLLQSPLQLVVENGDASTSLLQSRGLDFVQRTDGAVAWESAGAFGPFEYGLQARMEFDGFLEYKVTLKAAKECTVRDIRLEIPLVKDVARYMMGMGFKGGYRPKSFGWSWDQRKNQDAVWVGDVNAGLQAGFRDRNYVRPLNTNFYLQKPLNLPPSWHNQGRGGCRMAEDEAGAFRITAYSGARSVVAGDELHFDFTLLLTPFKTLDTAGQWSTRYYHDFKPPEEILAAGANTVNVHHATAINPFINYPFLRPAEMKKYVDEAHAKGLKVKIYYTVRELSNRAPELYTLASLGDEILAPGPGGGYAWLQEHMNGNYIAGWLVPELQDAALVTSGVSRWHNYYVEGMAWLVRNIGIDGLYIDDVAFDRTVMKRVRRVLDAGRPAGLIDLHSANQYNERDGFASSANLYLEHFPYLNRLWFGEYFDYSSPPDYWLVEISGIPFGLMGEMLQDGGNAWHGMVYGMTSRLPWSGDPRPLWRVWDDFGIGEARMFGYWAAGSPVRSDRADVLATVYAKKEKVLIALSSWAKEKATCRLRIDWTTLGLDAKKSVLTAPPVAGFQEGAAFNPRDAIPVEPGKGWLLILEQKKR